MRSGLPRAGCYPGRGSILAFKGCFPAVFAPHQVQVAIMFFTGGEMLSLIHSASPEFPLPLWHNALHCESGAGAFERKQTSMQEDWSYDHRSSSETNHDQFPDIYTLRNRFLNLKCSVIFKGVVIFCWYNAMILGNLIFVELVSHCHTVFSAVSPWRSATNPFRVSPIHHSKNNDSRKSERNVNL